MNTRIYLRTAILVCLVINQSIGHSTSNICDSPKCAQEAANIVAYVDPRVNPCEDFHQFACGNFLENAHGDVKLKLKYRIVDENIQETIKIYQEAIDEFDHKMVKFLKKLYQKCTDEWKISNDLHTVKIILKYVGGWPVLEGFEWNEENFDWVNVTYTLRRLGYDHTAFFSLYVEQDPDNGNKYIMKVVGGYRDYAAPASLTDMVKVAVLFGAKSEQALDELTATYEFLKAMRDITDSNDDYEKHTVEEIQKSVGVISWLEFINNITHPVVKITKDDYIMVPTNTKLKRLIDLIVNTPKRIQANYMLWTAVKGLVRFIPNCPGSPGLCIPGMEKPLFCLVEIHLRQITEVPNPIDMIKLRRYLSEEKRKKVETFVMEVKSEFVKSVSKIRWLPEETKHTFVDEIKEAEVVVGYPANYFDNKILDMSDVDMIGVEDSDSFFALFAELQRNFESAKYIKLNKSASEYNYGKHIADKVFPLYSKKSNILYVPPASTKPPIYDPKRPEYLNYGMLGTLVANELTKELFWQGKEQIETQTSFRKVQECLKMESDNNTLDNYEKDLRVSTTTEKNIAEQVSYFAYEKWVENNSEGPKLIGIEYTPRQLFWISATSRICEPVTASQLDAFAYYKATVNADIYSVFASLSHNPNFAKDFNCPVNSKLNPTNRCNIL